MSRIQEFLTGKTILITGATGFLGQPLVEKILWAAPDVAKIYVLIRPKRHFGGRVFSAQERLERELYGSSVFERLQSRLQDQTESFLREKLIALAGDISEDGLGLEPDLRSQLQDEVGIVINSAAVVSFDAPLDSSLELNVFGAKRVAEFAAGCKDAILVHVSTAYVCGAARGPVPETLHHTAPPDYTGSEDPPRAFTNPEAEVERIKALIREIEVEAEDGKVTAEIEAALEKREKRRRGRKTQRKSQELENLRKKWLKTALADRGMKLARSRGWNDTYTYTKALGEQFVSRMHGSVPTVIVRPSVIESSLSEPNPGWLDGLRMADPLIVAIGKGRLRSLPLNPSLSLDLVPVDMVVNAMLAAMPETTNSEKMRIIHVATGATNPITMGDLYKLIFRYFRGNPMLDKVGNPIAVKPLRFPKPSTFRLQHRLKSVPLDTAERTLEVLPGFDATQKAKRKISATKAAHERLYYYGEIYEPYLNLNCQFQVDETMKLYRGLSEQEQKAFNFDVTRLNWRHYIQNVHIPGVKKFILKIEGTGTLELQKDEGIDFPPTIRKLLERSASRHPEKTALQIKRDGKWEALSFGQLLEKVDEVARHLMVMGLKKGDRIVLFSENQPEWGVAYLAAMTIGAIVVPIDSQTWHREVWSVVSFTEAKALMVSERCFKRLPAEGLEAAQELDDPPRLLNVDAYCTPFEQDPVQSGRIPAPAGPESTEFPELDPDDPASIVFTTGTAVEPKGAVHTHRNFLNNLRGVHHYLSVSEKDRFLSVLPLYHTLEFSCGFLMAIYGCASVTYLHSLKPRVILETMREVGVTCMLGVPTLYSLIREDIERRILKASKSPLKTNLMNRSKQLSHSVERRLGMNIGKKLFARVHQEFGESIRVFVSGGSALGESLYRDFKALGMPIYEGYGLTETAPVLTVNPLRRHREGSAGKPLPGVELRLYHPDQDGIGEIIVRSPSLMREYYKNSQATSSAFKDGWFHTGDLGWVDADGYIYITGRIKNVIVTGAGKNVYPTDVEAAYATLPIIKEICVVGLKSGLTEDVCAVVFPTAEETGDLSEEESKKAVLQSIQRLAKELPSYQRLQAVHIWNEPLPRDAEGAIDRDQVLAQVIDAAKGTGKSRKAGKGKEVSRREQLYGELSRLSGLEPGEITEETNLYSDLGLDSLMAVELLLFLERDMKIIVTDEKVANFQTVGDVLDELRRQRTDGGSDQEQRSELRTERSALPLSLRPGFDRAVMRGSFASLRTLFKTLYSLKVRNSGVLPKDRPYIIAANHTSHLDTPAVLAAVSLALGSKEARKLHVIGARDYFFDSPLKSWLFSTCLNVVPIDREEISLSGLRMISSILENGESVLIFPEGTRTRTGQLQDFKPGIGLIALEFGAPVIPAFIEGAYEAFPPGKAVPTKGKIEVRFGEPIHASAFGSSGETAERDELYRRIAAEVRDAVKALG